jgi:hypothetical protein
MKQYIDKAVLVAEIDDWRDKIKKGIFSIPLSGNERAYATFEYEVLGKVISFLDSLEVKETKNQEWSADDERNLNVVLSFIDDEYLRRWLKDVVYEKI